MKDLTKPTPRQIVDRNRALANELIANKRKGIMTMRNSHGGRCCLQVAEDYAISCGLKIKRSDKTACEPETAVGNFFGWDVPNPQLITPNGKTYLASSLNDGVDNEWKNKHLENKGLPHKHVAECFLNTYVTPKRPKWSFKLELDEDA